MTRKIISLLTAAVLILCCFAGCSDNTGKEDGKISIVCTVFPIYDWARNIIGDTEGVDLTLLLDSGTDLHSYQPNAADIIKVTSADIFVYVGGTSDKWVDEVFKTSPSETEKIDLMEILGEGLYDEETVEGMEAEEEEEEEDGIEYDEHVWLSLKNADKYCTCIKDALCKADPANADTYTANCGNYRQSLAVLGGDYEEAVKQANRKTLLFADRFPFRYLIEDLGLDYYAAFVGCSTETNASFETIIFLADKVDELKLPVILVTETSDQSVANTVKDTTKSKNAEILVLDAMQSVTSAGVENGTTYLGTMENNLAVLKKALA